MDRIPTSDESKFDELFSRYVDGAVTAQELSELEARLLADDDFAQQFSRWCLLHRQIHELLSESTLHQLMEQYVTGSAAMPKKALSKSTPSTVDPHVKASERGAPIPPTHSEPPVGGPAILQTTRLWWRGWTILGTAAAASLVFVVWISGHLNRTNTLNVSSSELASTATGAPTRSGG